MAAQKQQPCPRCARGFECGADAIKDCPCSTVGLSPEARELIARRWDGCLCPPCLQELQELQELSRQPRRDPS